MNPFLKSALLYLFAAVCALLAIGFQYTAGHFGRVIFFAVMVVLFLIIAVAQFRNYLKSKKDGKK